MKISINSTFSYIKLNLNYGSALQCYALQKALKSRGHTTFLVRDYRANPKQVLRRLKNIKHFSFFVKKAKAQCELQRFIRRNIDVSDYAYFTYASLKKRCPEADCHIVGSDQVWRNTNSSRYLTYVPDEKLKLSYAASFGQANLSHDMQETIRSYFSRFSGITVRETSGVEILEKMGYKAQKVLDPTLLLDWEQYPYKANNKTNYCFCYFLNLKTQNDVPIESIKAFCDNQKKEMIVTAPVNYPILKKYNPIFPSVEDWLGLYKSADFIFTNTYHGLLFCIIFKKQFLLFSQKGSTARENDRFSSILETLDLTDRLISAEDTENICTKIQKKIDYDKVYATICKERLKTDDFFRKFGL